jgi:hypothetical protein
MPLTMEDLPRPEARPGPSRRWRADRPGDLTSPAEVPWGGAFGTPGPDSGYAQRLLAGRAGEPRETRALAVIVAARASRLGRAPVVADVAAAEAILALLPAERSPGHGAEGRRRLLEALDPRLLSLPLDELRRRRPAPGA